MGRADLHRAPVDMDQLVTEVIGELASDLAGRNVEWHREPLPSVTGDRGLLKQVWINLLSNAVKYSRPRNPAVIHVSSTRANDQLTFVLKDNGVGFDMQYADKIFGVFQRLHHVDEFEGTGIGLSLVQRIIQRHGGSVRAHGILDEGATISFTLPDGDLPTSRGDQASLPTPATWI
jgi:light-regulated signal transduction histidine kinase (bacteriophytochrome)